MNNPFDYIPDDVCNDAFNALLAEIDTLKKSQHPDDVDFCRELESGKMLGVLIATDTLGNSHTLYAFSGQIGDGGFRRDGFVDPVFDYLQPNGYFKTKEAEISRLNYEIARFERQDLASIAQRYKLSKDKMDSEIAQSKESYRQSRLRRDLRRKSGLADEAELNDLIRESQFEKAELHRLKQRLASEISPLETELKEAQTHIATLKSLRRSDSEALQQWLFANFKLLNARHESKSLSEIFAVTPMGIPPSGSGECCAPKLLQAAYAKGWTPVSIAEYWYGKPKGGEVRIHGMHYPACRGKCLPVLNWMLQGLEVNPPLGSDYNLPEMHLLQPKILFENQWFCIVDKPSGMLSVQGNSAAVSVQKWLQDRYGTAKSVKMAHRLDRDTSGLLIATFNPISYKAIQSLFATRKVKKSYEAMLDGNYLRRGIAQRGHINLPISPDPNDRPRQRIDFESGKEAQTDYEFIDSTESRSRVIFYPLTGRTHQLRVHASAGLEMPISGDPLYGDRSAATSTRLQLHAQKIEFTFPLDGLHYTFESPTPF